MKKRLLLVDENINISQNMINNNVCMIFYNIADDITVLDGKIKNIAKDNHLIESIGMMFHGSSSIAPIIFNNSIDGSNINIIFKRLIDDNGVKNIDFIACNLASYEIWRYYFDKLRSVLNITVGASTAKVGNKKNGGSWILDVSYRNVKTLYFNNNINEFNELLSGCNVI